MPILWLDQDIRELAKNRNKVDWPKVVAIWVILGFCGACWWSLVELVMWLLK